MYRSVLKVLAGIQTPTFREWNVPILAIAVALGVAICCSTAEAQSGAGSIVGTVTDSTNAAIVGASIHVVNQGTNTISDTKTNDVGFYEVPDLFTGTYTVTVSAPGMKTYDTKIELLVDQHAVINQVMTAGSVTQRIEVKTSDVQLVNADDGTITSTLENQRINQIPMNTREIVTLAQQTTPGLESNSGTGTRANGLMQEALEYVADGAPLDNRNFGGSNASTQGQFPDADSIQEVQMETTDANAAFATPGTAIITTKSGTNSIHGSIFETAVNSFFGIAKLRSQPASYHELPYVRNEFGMSAGGPIVLPHIYDGKNKSFWFFAFERFSLASTTPELVSVPDANMEAGNFSEAQSGGTTVQLYDPLTTAASANCNGAGPNQYCRTPFAGNQIPLSRLDPTTKTLYSLIPQPSLPGVNPFVTGNLNAPNVSYVVVPTVTFRLDQNFTADNKAYLRFTSNEQTNRALRNYPNNTPATIASGSFPAAASGYQIIPVTNFAAAVGYTHIFSPTFFSETIASQQWFRQYVGGGGNPNLDYDQMLGLPNNFGETGFPQITGMHTFQFGGTMYQYQQNQIISNLDENLTKTFGKHQMQFGGRFRHERLYYLNGRNADSATFADGQGTGLYSPSTQSGGSTTNGSAAPFTGDADADFFLGNAELYSTNLEPPPSWFTDFELDAYYQDNWHVSKNLTLNLGLRYEAHPGRAPRGDVTDSFDLTNHAIVLGQPAATLISEGYTSQAIINNMTAIGVKFETPQQAGMPSNLQENADLIFEPRIGFAWKPFGDRVGTVLRGGYGRYTFPVPTRSSNPGATGLPFAYAYSQNYSSATQSPDGAPNYQLRNPQSVFMGQNSSGVVNTNFTGLGGVGAINPGFNGNTPTYYSPDYKPAAATTINVTLEQPFKNNSAVRFSWVYSHGSYLDRYWEPNNAPSPFIWELQTGTAPPQGGASTIGTNQYAATATNPYDNTVYGNFNFDQKNGWSNDNEFEVNYQRIFHNGFAYQIFYTWSRAFRVGDNSFRDSQGYPAENYFGTANNSAVTLTTYPGANPITLPGIPPAPPAGNPEFKDYKALDVWEDYKLDSQIPPHHIQFNYVYDLPFGRGKKFLGKANKFVDELVGGYQLAGTGNILNQIFQPASSNWGPISKIHLYKHKAPITDCRSGVCRASYEWFNGYIPPSQNGNTGCTVNCVYGLPAGWTPYQEPINTVVGSAQYNTNNVMLSGGSLGTVGGLGFGSGSLGANPYAKTFIHGPWNWDSDMSLYKVFPITERYNLRFNLDVFNFLNHQGFVNPQDSTAGTEAYLAGGVGASSYNSNAREIQLSLRLSF